MTEKLCDEHRNELLGASVEWLKDELTRQKLLLDRNQSIIDILSQEIERRESCTTSD